MILGTALLGNSRALVRSAVLCTRARVIVPPADLVRLPKIHPDISPIDVNAIYPSKNLLDLLSESRFRCLSISYKRWMPRVRQHAQLILFSKDIPTVIGRFRTNSNEQMTIFLFSIIYRNIYNELVHRSKWLYIFAFRHFCNFNVKALNQRLSLSISCQTAHCCSYKFGLLLFQYVLLFNFEKGFGYTMDIVYVNP